VPPPPAVIPWLRSKPTAVFQPFAHFWRQRSERTFGRRPYGANHAADLVARPRPGARRRRVQERARGVCRKRQRGPAVEDQHGHRRTARRGLLPGAERPRQGRPGFPLRIQLPASQPHHPPSPRPPRSPQSVNAVRFSPDGETLASASDDTSIILWKDKGVRPSSFGSSAPQGDGTWGVMGILRGHCADVYDLSWSPDGQVRAPNFDRQSHRQAPRPRRA